MDFKAKEATRLLSDLIRIPSLSREEEGTAALLEDFFANLDISIKRLGNNIIVLNKYFDPDKKTILLNSHHDTVKPGPGWTKNPFKPEIVDNKLFGLGSNDAGGCLVSLIASFLHFYDRKDLKYNILLVASAEEEISGKRGIELVLKESRDISFAIVGEPTTMKMAVAEKGLMVLDVTIQGKAGHAARNEGVNAIYLAMEDIQWFRTYEFPRVSESLGLVNMNVTVIQAGEQHNVVPGICKYVVDVRNTDAYTNEEILDIITQNIKNGEVVARSTRLQPSGIASDHPLVLAASRLDIMTFGSPTLSDQALIPYPSVKIGPGDSARSHTADEFIFLNEIEEGIHTYIKLLEELSN